MVAVLLFDVDGLRQVNESLGHAAGDKVLAEVARRLRASAPSSALVGRLGGDEFAVTLRVDHAEAALALAGELREQIRDQMVFGTLTLDVETAVGVVVHPDHGSDAATLLQRADLATTAAKTVPGSIQLFNPGLESRSVRRLALAGDLRRAIDNDELEIYFQPKVTLADRRLIGVECLARWEHPAHGAVAAGRLRRGRRAHRPARAADRGRAQGGPAPLPRLGGRRPSAVDRGQPLRPYADRPGLPDPRAGAAPGVRRRAAPADVRDQGAGRPRRHRPSDADPAPAARHRCTAFGGRLRHRLLVAVVPAPAAGHEVKVDRSFVQGMATDPGDLAIVNAVVTLSQQFGLTVVAEGVESELTLELLQDIGCEVGQGFLFSRPLPYERLEAWFSAQTETEPTRRRRGPPAARRHLTTLLTAGRLRRVRRLTAPRTAAPVLVACGRPTSPVGGLFRRLRRRVLVGCGGPTSLSAAACFAGCGAGSWSGAAGRLRRVRRSVSPVRRPVLAACGRLFRRVADASRGTPGSDFSPPEGRVLLPLRVGR